MSREQICVLGAGSWGTALALLLARSGVHDVRLVARDRERADAIASGRENSRYLPGVHLPDNIQITDDIARATQNIDACVYALPCIAADECLPLLADGEYPVIAACKGLHPETLLRIDEVMAHHISHERIALLSGPSFAVEVARGHPTAITMAAETVPLAAAAAAFFDDTNFRVYLSDDLIGVAMGGALKNVIAIAAGMADGLELGHNSVAAAVTRGLSEMARLSTSCGGHAETLMGLSGLGDLVLTCTGTLSRNRQFGMAIAKGTDCESAAQQVGQVVEGVRTAKAVNQLAEKFKIELPLMQSVHRVLAGECEIHAAIRELMARPEHPE